MGYFDADFAAVDELFSEAFGGTIVYIGSDGESVVDDGALIESEKVESRNTDEGVVRVRVRQFSIRRDKVDRPLVNAVVRIGTDEDSEPWPIARIMGTDSGRTKVQCERQVIHERTKRNFRGGSR